MVGKETGSDRTTLRASAPSEWKISAPGIWDGRKEKSTSWDWGIVDVSSEEDCAKPAEAKTRRVKIIFTIQSLLYDVPNERTVRIEYVVE